MGVVALHPQSFLTELLHQEPEVVMTKLRRQALDRKRTLPQLLDILRATLPNFVEEVPKVE